MSDETVEHVSEITEETPSVEKTPVVAPVTADGTPLVGETKLEPTPEPMFVNATSWLQPSAQYGDESLKGELGLVQIPQHSAVNVSGPVVYDEHDRRWRAVMFETFDGFLQVSNLREIL